MIEFVANGKRRDTKEINSSGGDGYRCTRGA